MGRDVLNVRCVVCVCVLLCVCVCVFVRVCVCVCVCVCFLFACCGVNLASRQKKKIMRLLILFSKKRSINYKDDMIGITC